MKEIEASLDTLSKVVDYLNEVLSENAIVFLRGDLASGKTTLTQAIAKEKGIVAEVTSASTPFTFAIACVSVVFPAARSPRRKTMASAGKVVSR